MPADGRRASGTPIRLGTIVVVLLMLSIIGCTTVNVPQVCAACTRAASSASPVASSTAWPWPITPLPTFPLHPATSPPTTSKHPKATLTADPKREFHALTDWALGPSEKQTSRVKDVAYGRYEPGDIVVEWWLYNYPSADSLRGGGRVDACTIMMGIAHGRVDYTSAVLHGYVRSGQVQGSRDEGRLVVSLTYYKSTAEKIDFYDLCWEKIYDLADRSLIAPDFR